MGKKIRNIICIPFICMIVGYLLLVLVNLIPYNWIKNEAIESADILMSQGTYASGYLEGWFLDNWTDADCISIVVNKSSTNPFYNAINAFQLSGEDDPYTASVEALQSAVNDNGINVGDHSYLWNGFQIWLRILMIKYNISAIRMFTYLVTIFLLVLVCVLNAKIKGNVWAFIPFLAAFSFFNFQMESLSLMFFNDICVMLLASIFIFIIHMHKKDEYTEEFFAFVGATVAFTSMVIMPLITLCFPLIIFSSLRKEINLRTNIVTTLKCIGSWAISYGITMITKILLSIFVINQKNGWLKILSYTGQESYDFKSRLDRILEVFLRIGNESEIKIHLAILSIVVLLMYLVMKKRSNLKKVSCMWHYLVIALIPCAWCFICVGHAGHGWTQWEYSISFFAILQLLWELCDFKDVKELELRKVLKQNKHEY